MNYMRELNAFYDWLDSNPLSSHAVALWYTLMAICNRAGWPEEFTVANATLQAKTGLSRKQLNDSRATLNAKGRIVYKQSKRVNEAGRYSIVSFGTQEGTRGGTQADTQTGSRMEHETVHKPTPLFKQETKTETKTERELARAQIVEAYEQVCGPLRGDPSQLEALLDYYERAGMDIEVVLHALRKSSTADHPAKYAGRILYAWERKGVRSMADIADLETTSGGERIGGHKVYSRQVAVAARRQRTREGDTPGAY